MSGDEAISPDPSPSTVDRDENVGKADIFILRHLTPFANVDFLVYYI